MSRLPTLPTVHAYGKKVVLVYDTRIDGYAKVFPAGLIGRVPDRGVVVWADIKIDGSSTLVDFGYPRGVRAMRKELLRLAD